MLFSKLNGMVPDVLDYSTLRTGGKTPLAACHDLCKSHGSTYFESGTAGRHHANNCVCAKVSQTMPPNPDGNANWNIYTVCPKPTTTTTTLAATTAPAAGPSCDSTEPLVFSTVSGDLDSRGGLRFPNVKAGVDLVMRTVEQGAYTAVDASLNGLVGGDFARINVKCGSDVTVEAITVKTGTVEPVVQTSIAFTLFDMDEGKRQKGRVSLQTCSATGASFPSNTELSAFETNGCILVGSCAKGKKGNDPTALSTLTEDHSTRAASLFWANTARITFKMAVGAGAGGRNFQFAFVPTNACLPGADNDFRPPVCCPKGVCQNSLDFVPPPPAADMAAAAPATEAPTTAAPAVTAAPPAKVGPKCVKAELTGVDLPKKRDFKKTEKAVQNDCLGNLDCEGYFQGASGWHILVPGTRTFKKGKPNKSIKVVKTCSSR
jgi:hypothetical protein